MSTIIRADTAQLRAVARQMRSVSAEILTGSGAADQAMQALDAVWSGSARDRGMARWAEIAPRYQPDAERLIHLANELEALAQRLDDAAAVFGDGLINAGPLGAHGVKSALGNGTPPELDIPRNMYDMYRKIREEPEIKVFQVGENEYAITIDGTDKYGIRGGNSWENAFLSRFGINTPYADRVREALHTLPPGAQVHLFGYSQGGIVANNIAQEKDAFARDGIDIKSVNTFGAPLALKYVGGVEYNEFDAPGDFVSGLNSPIALKADSSIIVQGPESYAAMQLFNLGATVFGAHSSYDDSSSLIAKKMHAKTLPFEDTSLSQWRPYEHNGQVVKFDMSNETLTLGEIGASVTQKSIDTYNAATDLAHDIARETGDFVGGVARETGEYIGDVRDAVQQRLPEPMRRIPGLF